MRQHCPAPASPDVLESKEPRSRRRTREKSGQKRLQACAGKSLTFQHHLGTMKSAFRVLCPKP